MPDSPTHCSFGGTEDDLGGKDAKSVSIAPYRTVFNDIIADAHENTFNMLASPFMTLLWTSPFELYS